LPSSVRPIGAQLSTRAVAPLGNNFACAQAGDAIKRMANTSFFISFSRKTCTVRPPLKRIDKKKSTAGVGFEQRAVRLYSPVQYLAGKLFGPQILLAVS
jgi:hypothetical protein